MDIENLSSEELETEISNFISSGHLFSAHDLARQAFEKYPDDLQIRESYALVLLKTGAVDEAKNLIYPIIGVSSEEPKIDILTFQQNPILQEGEIKILEGIGQIFREIWKFSKNCHDLDISRELYLACFKRQPTSSLGMNAAWLSWFTGNDEQSKSLAGEVLKLLPPMGLQADFNELINFAEAQLLIGRVEDACRFYEEAMRNKPKDYVPVVAARQRLYFLKDAGFQVPTAALDILIPPTIVVFSGPLIDRPDLPLSIFPNELENAVLLAIKEKLEEIDARIGYSSLSCGADILFCEAMLEREGEINIVLPFEIADFVESFVRHAGPRWERRFERILEKARTVRLAVEDRYLGHDMLIRFSNRVMHGISIMRGKFLTSDPHLVAVWDSKTSASAGNSADFVDYWSDIKTLHLIDLDELRPTKLDPAMLEGINLKTQHKKLYDPFKNRAPNRTIKSMMFSDLHGYSKLQDEHIPAFLDFLYQLKLAMSEIDLPLESVNTWGDAIFVVTNDAITTAEFGLRYCDIIETLGKKYPEFPFPIRARISLHSGPVYEAQDPFLEKRNYYGGHINRAARLEPVTTVGQVYATHQFVAILHAELDNLKNEFEQKGLKYNDKFLTEYVGVISLAKSFGKQEVYHLRWR